ncbi:MAG: class I SAM-dependent methyltransferase [Candidatus ainarchaeum sp.]|nr:class I SAM-dependent methyltransferase [Candidatus ainarchaeum sp.]
MKSKNWEKEFERNDNVETYQEINNYWWVDCYKDIDATIKKNIPIKKNMKILECGSGTGNSSLLLAKDVNSIVLLDQSKSAINSSKKLAKYYDVKNVDFLIGDIFKMPFKDKIFDFCWNIGVLEHYDIEEAKKMILEMRRVTKENGYMCIGVPNFRSLAIIKARFLSNSLLRPITNSINGYRLDDEKKYTIRKFKEIFSDLKDDNIFFKNISFHYAGSFLPVETSHDIYKKLIKFKAFLNEFSFLILVIIKR